MGDFMKIVLYVVILIGAFVLSQIIVGWKTRGACRTIIKDLQTREAYGPDSAAALPYAQRKSLLHFGAKDYKPQALQQLVMQKIVNITDDGKFYLGENARNIEL
jgi:hypothetical protein